MLKQRAFSALLWSVVEQVGAGGINTLFMLLFARLLTPTDFGIFASATLVAGFVGKIAHLGMDTVVVQRREVDSTVLSTAFWMVMPLAATLAIAMAVMADMIAAVFGDTAIVQIVPYMAFGMVVMTATGLMTALLRRELNMRVLAKRTLLAHVLSGIVATPFAFSGFGAMALVIQFVGGAILSLLLTVMAIGWRIRFTFDRRAAREMLHFGMPITGADLLTRYNRESPQLYVGLFLGTEALGIMSMAMRVMNLLITVVGTSLSRVTLPLMSEVNRTTSETGFRDIYLRLVRLGGSVVLPVFLLCIVLREELVSVLLGIQWVNAVPIVGLLCAAGILTTLNFVNGSTLVALGRPQARFWFSALRAVVGTILLLIATPFGALYAGLAFLLRGVFVEPLQLVYLLRRISATPRAYLMHLRGALVASAVLGAIAWVVQISVPVDYELPTLIVSGALAMAGYMVTMYWADSGVVDELRRLAAVRSRP